MINKTKQPYVVYFQIDEPNRKKCDMRSFDFRIESSLNSNLQLNSPKWVLTLIRLFEFLCGPKITNPWRISLLICMNYFWCFIKFHARFVVGSSQMIRQIFSVHLRFCCSFITGHTTFLQFAFKVCIHNPHLHVVHWMPQLTISQRPTPIT